MVEKMKLLHITGPKEDLDRVMDVYLSKYEIHFENAIASLSNLTGVRPFAGNNPYWDAYTKAKGLWEYLKDEPIGNVTKMKPGEAQGIVEAAYRLTEEIQGQQEELRQERLALQKLMAQIEPFRKLDYEVQKILEFQFIAFRFGRISRDYYHKLEQYIHRTDYVLFYECHTDENFVWGAYFVPEVYKTRVDAVCLSFHFERILLPDHVEGTTDAAYLNAAQKLAENEKERARLEKQLHDTLLRHRSRLAGAYDALKTCCENFDIRKLAVCTKSQRKKIGGDVQEYYILYGWMSKGDAEHLLEETEDDALIQITPEETDGDIKAEPPTKLKNPSIFRPFEMFVTMYGLPAYNEMDPTIFVALTYSLMFGIMFGDVGQGLCLLVGGFVLYRVKKMNLAAILSLAGVWSTVFGFLYGSIFGFEDILEPLWMRPMDNIMTTLVLAIGFGAILILIAMVINLVNALRAKERGRLLFSQSGVAGILCYGSALLCILLYVTGHPLPATGILVAAVGVPLLAIMLKEPLGNLLERKGHVFPAGSKAMYFVEAFVELFDVVLSYATNSISFVRVGAFALSHAGMMGVVLTLSGYESGSPNWLVVVLGNIVVTGLEGLVVGIQVLRLEYYEMFSRFYKGSGKPFRSFFQKQKKDEYN